MDDTAPREADQTHLPATPTTKRMAVIGAGACGLATTKYMVEAGFDVTLFEKGTQIGGLWCYQNDSGTSAAYKTLHINTAKNVTCFTDFKFDDDVQAFPDHWDMHKFLCDYADHFDIRKRIRFNSEVKEIRPAFTPGKEEPKWEVEIADGTVETFDRVFVANGHLTKPLHVPQFQNDFKGRYLHVFDYEEPANHVGERICVVGAGNSALDAISDVCVGARRTVMVARTGIVVGPKLLFGYPFTDVTWKLNKHWIPSWMRDLTIRSLVYFMHGSMTRLGFPPLTQKVHPATNATAVQHIAYKRVEVKQGIDHIDGKTIHFVDGTSEEFDTLIAATGYLIDLPFLSRDIVPINDDNSVDLYKNMISPDWPGLYIMGMFNIDTSLNQVFEWQAKWLREFEVGNAVMPSAAEMRADMDAYRAWVQRSYKRSDRHGIELEHLPYYRGLIRAMMKCKLRAWLRRLGGGGSEAPSAAGGAA